MKYYVRRQGRDLGLADLDELRQQREAGELQDDDYVWRQGMPNWQPLEMVLRQHTSGGPPPLPPPPPVQGSKTPSNRVVIWIVCTSVAVFVLYVGIIAFMGVRASRNLVSHLGPLQRGSQGGADGREAAARPVIWNSNTLTEADVQVRERAFQVRNYLDEYKEHNADDPALQAQGIELIDYWLTCNFGGHELTNKLTLAQWGDKVAANPACDDPLVLTVAAETSVEMFEKGHRLDRALLEYPHSSYRAYPQFFATVELAGDRAELASDANYSERELDEDALKLLRKCFSDGSVRPEDQEHLAESLIHGWGYSFLYRNQNAVEQIVKDAGKSYEWLALVVAGKNEINQAWAARGSGTSDTVTMAGWEGFNAHLKKARSSLTQAWKLRPDLPLAPSEMITVALGESGADDMRLWFDRTTAAQIDYPRAWSDLRWGLRPRWYGSLEAMKALGISAIHTGRFDTDVPKKFFDSVVDMESELDLGPGEHIYGRKDIWPQLRKMYEGYIDAASQASSRDAWRSSYAVVAYLAGKYDVSRKQLEALNWEPYTNKLTGWNADLSLMALEVAARTSAISNGVAGAEENRADGNGALALTRYQSLGMAPGVDARTQSFIQHRIASLTLEAQLDKGAWTDFLPTSEDDPNWVASRGKFRPQPDGSVDVESGPDGHMIVCRARVGPDFEVKGQFEVQRSSTPDFQAGLVMGMPDFETYNWYGFRMKRHKDEGQLVAFAQHWSGPQITKRLALNDVTNTFDLRFQADKVTATVNGTQVFSRAKPPAEISVSPDEMLLGLGAFNDVNDTVIRYRNIQVRKLPHQEEAGNR